MKSLQESILSKTIDIDTAALTDEFKKIMLGPRSNHYNSMWLDYVEYMKVVNNILHIKLTSGYHVIDIDSEIIFMLANFNIQGINCSEAVHMYVSANSCINQYNLDHTDSTIFIYRERSYCQGMENVNIRSGNIVLDAQKLPFHIKHCNFEILSKLDKSSRYNLLDSDNLNIFKGSLKIKNFLSKNFTWTDNKISGGNNIVLVYDNYTNLSGSLVQAIRQKTPEDVSKFTLDYKNAIPISYNILNDLKIRDPWIKLAILPQRSGYTDTFIYLPGNSSYVWHPTRGDNMVPALRYYKII